jgi:hypothetical protein
VIVCKVLLDMGKKVRLQERRESAWIIILLS